MNVWRKPSIEATKHRYIVVRYQESNEDGSVDELMKIMSFNTIYNFWSPESGWPRLKLSEIKYWHPLPEIEKEPDE